MSKRLIQPGFLSTLSLRRATTFFLPPVLILLFLSTLSLRRATGWLQIVYCRGIISIHALLAESDRLHRLSLIALPISIHALLAESDCRHPARCVVLLYFYPRSPCGERLPKRYPVILGSAISIHALLAESDTWQRGSRTTYVISIHALLAESDVPPYNLMIQQKNFYPRSPCGERPLSQSSAKSTPEISIHALLAESDQANAVDQILPGHISIHALLAESDVCV